MVCIMALGGFDAEHEHWAEQVTMTTSAKKGLLATGANCWPMASSPEEFLRCCNRNCFYLLYEVVVTCLLVLIVIFFFIIISSSTNIMTTTNLLRLMLIFVTGTWCLPPRTAS